MKTDFYFRDEGSICLLTPLSAYAREWLQENIAGDVQTWGNATVIEPRYVSAILTGINEAGLSVQA